MQGVSTRKVCDILVKLLGPEVSISSTQVSRTAEKLDAGLATWRERPRDETPYLFLDARYERVREAGRLVDCEVLVARHHRGRQASCFRCLGRPVPGRDPLACLSR